MISGILSNNTVWWLSTDGQKIWIESKDIEQDKFKEKGYNVKEDIIYRAGDIVGELTASRLNSRKKKDAWVVKLAYATDVYPELIEEIKKKDAEDKKKKRGSSSKNRNNIYQKNIYQKNTYQRNNATIEEPKKDQYKNGIMLTVEKETNISIGQTGNKDVKEPKKDCFDINGPYVPWIKDEVEKSVDGKVMISYNNIKEKMGGDFLNMHDLRIFFGLKKILSDVGISVEQGRTKKEHVVIFKKL